MPGTDVEKGAIDNIHNEKSTSLLRYANFGKTQALDSGKALGRDVITEFKSFAESGPMSLRVLGFTSGFGAFVFSFVAIFRGVLGLSPLVATTDIFIMFFSVCIMAGEAKSKVFAKSLRQKLDHYARGLSLIMGRGVFYLYVGGLLSSLSSTINDTYGFCAGFFLFLVGFLYIYTGRLAKMKLKTLRDNMKNEEQLKKKFDEFAHGDNRLDIRELGQLCVDLGTMLSDQELEAALMMLDGNRNGFVEFDEFKKWWQSDEVMIF
jgi:hypothetical protein